MSDFHRNMGNVPFAEAPQPQGRRAGGKPAPKKQFAVVEQNGIRTLVEVPVPPSAEMARALEEAAKPKAPNRRNGKRERVFLADGSDIPHGNFYAIPVQKPEAQPKPTHPYGHFRTNASIAQFRADKASGRLRASDALRYDTELQEVLLRRHSPKAKQAEKPFNPKQALLDATPEQRQRMIIQQPEVFLYEWAQMIGKPALYDNWLAAGKPPVKFQVGGF